LVIQGKHLKTHYLQVNIKKLWPKKCHTILLCTCIYKMNIQTMNIEYPNTLYKRKIKQWKHGLHTIKNVFWMQTQ
jgi:hypothetical protein